MSRLLLESTLIQLNRGTDVDNRKTLDVFTKLTRYIEKTAPNWTPDWRNKKQFKWYLTYSHYGNEWVACWTSVVEGLEVYMPKDVCNYLCKKLNAAQSHTNNPMYALYSVLGYDNNGEALVTQNRCGCGKGFASSYDNLCRFCREHSVSRAEAKRFGVKTRGDGMTVEQLRKGLGLNVTRITDFDNLEDDEDEC